MFADVWGISSAAELSESCINTWGVSFVLLGKTAYITPVAPIAAIKAIINGSILYISIYIFLLFVEIKNKKIKLISKYTYK
uniref:Uncharacterized protein n=1 Tax=viral metagenome TaxID=1070528 RepID=A0A6C0HWQ4_9ZZZZ